MKGQGKNALGMLGWAAVALACMAGLAMGGDGKSPPPDFSRLGSVFDVKPADEPKRTSKKPAAKRPANEPPPMTCDGDQCWWTDLGKPNQ
jgi:hypothetical protein